MVSNVIDYEKIGRRVKAARKGLGFSQEDLSNKTGVSSRQISRIENGKGNVPLDTLAIIASHLNINMDNLLFRTSKLSESYYSQEVSEILDGLSKEKSEQILTVVKVLAKQ